VIRPSAPFQPLSTVEAGGKKAKAAGKRLREAFAAASEHMLSHFPDFLDR
jgi:hypothetical protein